MKTQDWKFKIRTGSLYFFLASFFLTLTTFSKAQDIQKLIPANSSGVVTMDGGAFFKKIDLDQINRLDMFQDMDEKTKGKKGSKYSEYSKIYKDPASIGLNLNSKSYIFFENSADTNMWGSSYMYSGLVMPLSNSKKFESFIKKIIDSSIVKQKDYKYTLAGFKTLIAWNKSNLLVLWVNAWDDNANTLLLDEFKKLTSQSAENSLKANKNFQEAQSQSFDFHYWMNFESYFNGLQLWRYMDIPLLKSLPFIGADFYKGYYLHMAMNYEKGSVNINSKQYLSNESIKSIEKLYGKGVTSDLSKFIEKDHLLGAYTYSLNMKEVAAIADTALHDTLKEQMNEGFVSFLYEKKIKEDLMVTRLQKQLDSMYTDLYPVDTTSYNYNYDDYNYEEDTTTYDTYDYNYEDSSTYEDNYDEDNYDSEDSYNDIVADSAVAVEDYSYDNYSYSKEDSIYDEKYKRIDLKRKEIEERKKVLAKAKLKELGIKGIDLLELFSGDVLFAITDLYQTEKKYMSYEYDEEELKTIEVEKTKKDVFPEFLFEFTLNKTQKASGLLSKLEKDSFVTKEGNYYFIQEEEHKVFIAITGNILVITNNENLIKNHFNGYSDSETISADIQKVILNRPSGLYVNLRDIFLRIPVEDNYKDKAVNDLLVNSFQHLTLTSDAYKGNVSQTDFTLNFTNKIDNSFYEIFRIINEIYKIHNK